MAKRKITDNPIALRSQKWLCDALIELMHEKPYKKITITEICNRAELARETFYRNFSSKEAIIKYCLEEKFQDFVKKIRDRKENINAYSVGLEIFNHWKKEKDFLWLLIENNLVNLIIDQLSKEFQSIGDFIIRKDETDEARYYIMSIYSGAYTNVLVKWILRDCQEPPEEMVRIMYEYGPNRDKFI